MTKLYLDCFAVATELIKNQISEVYFKVLNQYLIIAEQLKFTEDYLLTAYNKKIKLILLAKKIIIKKCFIIFIKHFFNQYQDYFSDFL